jgi:glutamate 5-kinase
MFPITGESLCGIVSPKSSIYQTLEPPTREVFLWEKTMKEQLLNTVEVEKFISKRMVVKIGSSSITKDGSPLNVDFVKNVAKQCSQLLKSNVEIAIISSGSVVAGKWVLRQTRDDVIHDQVAAIYGQSILMNYWRGAFVDFGINVGQILISEDDLKKPNTPIVEGLRHGIQVINANDAVNDSEMKAYLLSADNDKLAGHIAQFIGADTLVLLTDVDGVLNGKGDVIQELTKDNEVSLLGKSSVGTGGMQSKVNVGLDCTQQGIRTVIANAYTDEVLLKVAKGESVGTKIAQS